MNRPYVKRVSRPCLSPVLRHHADRIGQSSLSESCPVCEHKPLTPDLCKPNKALRTTLKAYLRTAEKKRRDLERAKNAEIQPATSVEATPAETPAPAPAEQAGVKREDTDTQEVLNSPALASSAATAPLPHDAKADDPRPSIEVSFPALQETQSGMLRFLPD